MCVNSLPKTVTRQRHDCDLNPGLLRLSSAPIGHPTYIQTCLRDVFAVCPFDIFSGDYVTFFWSAAAAHSNLGREDTGWVLVLVPSSILSFL